MAIFGFTQRIAVCFRLLFVLNSLLCFASAVHLPFESFQDGSAIAVVNRRAEGTKTFEIPFNITMSYGEIYGFDCSIGTPPQNVHLGINVYRSDTQVSMNITKNPWATAYNSTLSTTANPLLEFTQMTFNGFDGFESPNSNINYIEYVLVFYASDTFVIPGITNQANTTATFKDFQLVAWSNTTYNYNLSSAHLFDSYDYNYIALGLASAQAIVHLDLDPVNGKPYPTFAQHFIDNGNIESNTYSIWLDPVANQTGHLLLGGIDSFAYKDSLVNLPTVLNATSDPYGLRHQTVLTCSIDSIALNNSNNAALVSIPSSKIQHVVLAHSPVTLLEAKVARSIWDAVGASYNGRSNIDQIVPEVPCSYLTNSSTVDIKFSGANFTLSVPMSYVTAKGGQGPLRDSGLSADKCIFLIQAIGLGLPSLLGTSVLRNLYTVYDISNNILSVALTDFQTYGSGEGNVIAIPTGGVKAIASSAFVSKPAATGTGTGGSATSAVPVPSDTTTAGKGEGGGMGSGVKIGVGVAVPVVAIIGFMAAFLLFRRRRGKAKNVDGAGVKSEGVDGIGYGGKAELADNPKKETGGKGELMGNPVSEVGGVGVGDKVTHELPAPVVRHELA